MWVKPNATIAGGSYKRLIESGAYGLYWGVDITDLTAASGRLRFVSDGGSGPWSQSTPAISSLKNGQWLYLVFTMGSSGMNVFVNGTRVAGPIGWLSTGSGSDMRFGSGGSDSSKCLNASIDDIAAYNRVLTAAEMQTHYTAP